MIEETALVVDMDDQYAWVEASSQSTCSHCSAQQGCGTASLQKWFKRKPNRLKVLNTQKLQTGDQVIIGIPEQALVMGSFLLYILPLLALLAGALAGVFFSQMIANDWEEAISIVFGLSAFLGSYRWLKGKLHNTEGTSRYQPVILRRVL
jgi:sigma-E factor negative regulatory protein RseC